MATEANLTFKVGENWPITVACFDGSGAPISDSNPNFQFRLSQDGVNLIAIDTASGVWIESETPVVALISITPAMQVAASIAAGAYDWEGRLILADGTISDQAFGIVTVETSLFP